ncbi:hypothetical protein [Shewanella glacialipiscicola]|uniref:hypothetical protein n=1 Tax=Shewanella glacialipiscicola TaxID=614069 RepID=UPI003D7BA001
MNNNHENEQDNSSGGMPSPELEATIPTFNMDPEDTLNSRGSIDESSNDSPKKVPILFLVGIFLSVIFVLGLVGFGAIHFLSTEKDEVIPIGVGVQGLQSGARDLKVEDDSTAGQPELPIVPPIPEPTRVDSYPIAEYKGESGYQKNNEIQELNDKINTLTNNLSQVVSEINNLSNRIDTKLFEAQLENRKSLDDIKNELNGLLIGVDTIASHVKTQSVKVESVVKTVEAENQEKLIRASSPNFSVRGKSIWGEVVYLTVSTDQNFQQQVTVGQKVAAWTLMKVDLNAKKSYWLNDNGKTNEITIP